MIRMASPPHLKRDAKRTLLVFFPSSKNNTEVWSLVWMQQNMPRLAEFNVWYRVYRNVQHALYVSHMYNHFWLQIKWVIINLSTSRMWAGSKLPTYSKSLHTKFKEEFSFVDLLQIWQKILFVCFFFLWVSVLLSLFLFHHVKMSGKKLIAPMRLNPFLWYQFFITSMNPDRFFGQSMFH